MTDPGSNYVPCPATEYVLNRWDLYAYALLGTFWGTGLGLILSATVADGLARPLLLILGGGALIWFGLVAFSFFLEYARGWSCDED